MGRCGSKLKERKQRKSNNRVYHPKSSNDPKTPAASHPHATQHDELPPKMTDPWLVAPTSAPSGMVLVEYNMFVNDARTSVWKLMRGLKFHSLPFLTIDEMKNLVDAAFSHLPNLDVNLDNLVDGVCDLINRFLVFSMLKRFKNSYPPTAKDSKMHWYATVRQGYYNEIVQIFCDISEVSTAVEKRNKLRLCIKSLAGLRVEVLMKTVEACLQARREFINKYLYLNNPSNEETETRDTQTFDQLADQMLSDLIVDTNRRGIAITSTVGSIDKDVSENQKTAVIQPLRAKRHSNVCRPEERLIKVLDNFNCVVKRQELKFGAGYADWVQTYGTPVGVEDGPKACLWSC